MDKRLRRMIPWLIGALTAAILFLAVAKVGGLRYGDSDDMLFVKGFMGFEGGTPVSFTLYTHMAAGIGMVFAVSAGIAVAEFSSNRQKRHPSPFVARLYRKPSVPWRFCRFCLRAPELYHHCRACRSRFRDAADGKRAPLG